MPVNGGGFQTETLPGGGRPPQFEIHRRRQAWRRGSPSFIIGGMESPAEIRERWRHLRDLLIEQLARFESGAMQMHSDNENVSSGAIIMIKRHIREFDELIARSEARDA
jgi:hypothetical protein